MTGAGSARPGAVRLGRGLVLAGSVLAAAGTAHAVRNAGLLREPPTDPPATTRRVAVLLPCRDEAARVGPCLTALLRQRGVADLRVLVLDDASADGTAAVVQAVAGRDPRVTLLRGTGDPPGGWLGKPWACERLAAAALDHPDPPEVLVFLDADVVLAEHALAATVALLEATGLDLVSPYPAQVAGTPAERLVQPLLQWSWMTFLPLRLAERSPRPSLAAANGQLLAVRPSAYRASGGHAAVRSQVLEDVALLRAVKRAGGRGVVVGGRDVATCRMYDGWPELREGYRKSLWSAFGSPAGAAAVLGVLGVAYLVPPAAALGGSRVGAVGYAAAVAGRVVVARRTGDRWWPDALAHPVGVGVLGWLTVCSLVGRRRGTLAWRGRRVG